MADQDRERLLAAFADHLLKKHQADEKHGRYMVGWVRRFWAFPPPVPNASAEECLQAYLRSLESGQYKDWQVEQARMSVTVWLGWRRGQAAQTLPAPAVKVSLGADSTVDPGRVLDTLSETMRVRHCSYRTEQTYLDWVRRFFDYLVSAGQAAKGDERLTFNAQLSTLKFGRGGPRPGKAPGAGRSQHGEPWPRGARNRKANSER